MGNFDRLLRSRTTSCALLSHTKVAPSQRQHDCSELVEALSTAGYPVLAAGSGEVWGDPT
jgi:hypothetical protein